MGSEGKVTGGRREGNRERRQGEGKEGMGSEGKVTGGRREGNRERRQGEGKEGMGSEGKVTGGEGNRERRQGEGKEGMGSVVEKGVVKGALVDKTPMITLSQLFIQQSTNDIHNPHTAQPTYRI